MLIYVSEGATEESADSSLIKIAMYHFQYLVFKFSFKLNTRAETACKQTNVPLNPGRLIFAQPIHQLKFYLFIHTL